MTPRLPLRARRARAALLGALLVAGLAASVEAGHEVPYYPSFYPQEIGIERLEAGAAAAGLRKNLQAYVGADPFAGAALPADVASVTSLRSWLVVTFPARGRGTGDAASRCGAAARIGRGLAGKGAWVPFAYPVTPYHADYLGHADRVEEARRRAETAGAERNPPIPKLRASGRLGQGLAAAGLPSGGGEGSPVV